MFEELDLKIAEPIADKKAQVSSAVLVCSIHHACTQSSCGSTGGGFCC